MRAELLGDIIFFVGDSFMNTALILFKYLILFRILNHQLGFWDHKREPLCFNFTRFILQFSINPGLTVIFRKATSNPILGPVALNWRKEH